MKVTRLLVSTGALLIALGLTPIGIAYAQTPPSSPPVAANQVIGNHAPSSGGLFGILPDPRQWASDVFNQVIVNLLQSVSSSLHKMLDSMMNSQLNVITRTPPAISYGSPTVQALWNVTRGIADAGLVLLAIWAGLNLVMGEHLDMPYHHILELLPRLVVGAILVNTSLIWGQLAIDLNNALCSAIGQVILPGWDQISGTSQMLVDVITTLIYLVTGVLLLLQMLMRLALVDVLLVLSPIALACWILPQTQRWSSQWSTTFFGAVLTQFVQVVALKLGGALLKELGPMSLDTAAIEILLGTALMVLTLKLPGIIGRHAGDGLGLARFLAYRQVARGVDAAASRVP
jgi:hypothetical protein